MNSTSKYILPIIFFFVPMAVGAQAQSAVDVDRAAMEESEDLSESLANDLLDLSVAARNGDMAEVASYFLTQLRATPFPTHAGEPRNEVKWISAHDWDLDTNASDLSRASFLDAWRGFFGHFSAVEDVRFKVKGAEFENPAAGHAHVFFYIVGRDDQGRREWVRGWISVEAIRVPFKSAHGKESDGWGNGTSQTSCWKK